MSSAAVPDPELVETTTQLAVEEKGHLKKSLRRLDMVGFTVCAFVGLDTLGTVAANGPQGFTWLVVLAVLFVLPYALLMSEVGSAFTQEGGPYEWVEAGLRALARRHRRGPLLGDEPAVGRRLAGVHRDRGVERQHLRDRLRRRSATTSSSSSSSGCRSGSRSCSLKRGKWIPNIGALLRVVLLGFFTITTIVYAFDTRGRPASRSADLQADDADLPRARPAAALQLRRLRAAERRRRGDGEPAARRAAVARCAAASIGVLLYAIPMLRDHRSCCPAEKVTGIGGFLDAVADDLQRSTAARRTSCWT